MYICTACNKEVSQCEIGKVLYESLVVCWECKVKMDKNKKRI